jgi:hypothetical protein
MSLADALFDNSAANESAFKDSSEKSTGARIVFTGIKKFYDD